MHLFTQVPQHVVILVHTGTFSEYKFKYIHIYPISISINGVPVLYCEIGKRDRGRYWNMKKGEGTHLAIYT